ncbi:YciI family protein [Roseibium alexandrii]|uniref:YciI family protein n=1 Tax=Roseibium alexandrii TaxID=388408 RepID=UPI00374FE980
MMAGNLFVVDLTYIADVSKVDALLEPHRAFLKSGYDHGVFLASGPKEPRTGGVILARADTRAELEKLIDQDPFKQEGVAAYHVTEFNPVMKADCISF